MIGELHRCFTEQLLKSCNAPASYVEWATAPDEDLNDWHRVKFHRLSSFDKLYDLYIQKYDMRDALDKNIAYFVVLSHLYLDMLNGPLKVFDGINITVSDQLFKNIEKEGYSNTIRYIYRQIQNPNRYYIDGLCSLFQKTEFPDNISLLSKLFYRRLHEETIGDISNYVIVEPNVDYISYMYNYCKILDLEDKIELYTKHLL